MGRSLLYRVILTATLVGACAACSVPTGVFSMAYADREERVFNVGGIPQLRITTLRTAVEVRGSDRSEVRLTLERRAHDQQAAQALVLRSDQQGRVIDIDVRRPFDADFRLGRSGYVEGRLIISAPFATAIQVQTGAGTIESRNISGPIDVQSARGNISVAGVLTSIDARSKSGSIFVRADQGSAADRLWNFETIRGGILVESADGSPRVNATSRRGSVIVRKFRT